MRLITRHLFAVFLGRVLFLHGALLALLLAIDWMENLKRSKATATALLPYYALKLPAMLDAVSVAATALGIALGTYAVGRRLEWRAWAACGAPLPRVIAPAALLTGVCVAAVAAVNVHVVLPATRHRADALAKSLGLAEPGLAALSKTRHWFRMDEGLLRIGAVTHGDTIALQDVVWVRTGPDGPVDTVRARTARLERASRATRASHATIVMDHAERTHMPDMARSTHAVYTLEVSRAVAGVVQLVGHPAGLPSAVLAELPTKEAVLGHGLVPYHAERARRHLRPVWLVVAALLAALAAAHSLPKTGIHVPLIIAAAVGGLEAGSRTIAELALPHVGMSVAIALGIAAVLLALSVWRTARHA